MLILPKEIIKWIATGVDFGYHLIKVSTELVNTNLLKCRNKNKWSILLCYPAVLEFIESVVFLPLRFK